MSIGKQEGETEGSDINKPKFVGSEAKFYSLRLRLEKPEVIEGESVHEIYRAAIPDGPEFAGEQKEFYERKMLRLRGFVPKVIDQGSNS